MGAGADGGRRQAAGERLERPGGAEYGSATVRRLGESIGIGQVERQWRQAARYTQPATGGGEAALVATGEDERGIGRLALVAPRRRRT